MATVNEEASGYIDEEHWWATNPMPLDYPDTVETFVDVLKMLCVEKLDGETTSSFEQFAIGSTNELIARHGKEWMWRHKGLLKVQLESLAVF